MRKKIVTLDRHGQSVPGATIIQTTIAGFPKNGFKPAQASISAVNSRRGSLKSQGKDQLQPSHSKQKSAAVYSNNGPYHAGAFKNNQQVMFQTHSHKPSSSR
jgi:hypothetical protein